MGVGTRQLDFAEFYRSAAECLRAVLVSVGDHDTAQELVDEAFARARASWRTVSTHPAPKAWVVRTALSHRAHLIINPSTLEASLTGPYPSVTSLKPAGLGRGRGTVTFTAEPVRTTDWAAGHPVTRITIPGTAGVGDRLPGFCYPVHCGLA